jgi:hypothetical protein
MCALEVQGQLYIPGEDQCEASDELWISKRQDKPVSSPSIKDPFFDSGIVEAMVKPRL